MQVNKEIELVDLGLFLTKEKILVLADFHIGYERTLNKKGIFVPMFQFKDTITRIESLLQKIEPKKIIILGDLKHEFGSISQSEWDQTLELLDLLKNYCNDIVLLKGNHDKVLFPIAAKKNLEIKDHFFINDFYVCHGNKIPTDLEFYKANTLIIGHEHPAITLRDSGREETFKCFLNGSYKDKQLIVLPSFNLVTEGTNILKEELLSPFLKQDLNDFEVYIVGKKVYAFGKIKNLLKR